MLGADRLAVDQVQALAEHAHQRGVEGERAALEDHRGDDVEALCEAAERLLGDGVERRKRQIRLGGALVEQGLDVGLGVHAAAPRDLVDGGPARGEFVELLDGNLQKRRDLVDEGARAPGAAAVHAHVGNAGLAGGVVGVEEHHLGVLAAQLDRAARLRVHLAHRDRVGDDLLHVGDVEQARDRLAARSAYGEARRRAGEARGDVVERVADAFGLARVVALVARVQHGARRGVDHAGFRGGGAHVDADVEAAGRGGRFGMLECAEVGFR